MPAEAAYRMLRPFFYSTVRCVLRYQSRNASTDFKIWNIAAEDAMVLASSLDALCSVCTDIEAYIEWLEYEFKLFNFCCCLEAKQAVAQPFRVLLHHSSSSTSPLLHWAILSVMHLIGQGLIEKQRVSVECILVRIVPTFPSLQTTLLKLSQRRSALSALEPKGACCKRRVKLFFIATLHLCLSRTPLELVTTLLQASCMPSYRVTPCKYVP